MRIAITGAAGKLGRAVLQQAPPTLSLRLLDRVRMDGLEFETVQLDLEDGAAVEQALQGVDAVLHLAALPAPFRDRLTEVYRGNTMGTFHVCQACQRLGIKRLVFVSSLCYYGHVFRNTLMMPVAFPIAEAAPPRPSDAYSLSKVVCEEIVATYARAAAATAASLRFPLLRPGLAGSGEPFPPEGEWPSHFWSYLDLDDAARLVWQALAYTATAPVGHEAFNATADDLRSLVPTRDLLARYYPGVPVADLPAAPFTTCYATAKAKRLLAFAPTPPTWREKHG